MEDDLVICLSDIKRIIRQKKWQILWGALILALVFGLYTATRPVLFQAEGTFKEQGKAIAQRSSSLAEALLSTSVGGKGSEAITLLLSQRILDKVVETLCLQFQISQNDTNRGMLGRLFDNLMVDYAHLMKWEQAPERGKPLPIVFSDGHYPKEVTRHLLLRFYSEDDFEVWNKSGFFLGEGHLGLRFHSDDFSFVLDRKRDSILKEEEFNVTLTPLKKISSALSKSILIKPDFDNSSVLVIEMNHPQRETAVGIIDTLMKTYQEYLEEEHFRLAEMQLAYLKRRQSESFTHQSEQMQAHADIIADDLTNMGFADSEKEMEFLLQSHHMAKEKLIAIDLEAERLKSLLSSEEQLGHINWKLADTTAFNQELQLLNELKAKRDALGLMMTHNRVFSPEEIQEQFFMQKKELETLSNSCQEIHTLIQTLSDSRKIDTELAILNDPYFLVGDWLKSGYSETYPERESDKKNCINYLYNLARLYDVHKKIINERLAHHSFQTKDFEGIDYQTANELYIAYNRQANEIEAEIRQNAFILEQIEDPDFEISSLSAILNDPISGSIILESSNLALLLHDEDYRSTKEHQRTKHSLSTQKRFLYSHLKESEKVLTLKNTFLKEKMNSLIAVMLNLIHTKISLQEKHINDSIQNQIVSLGADRILIEKQMNQLTEAMSHLPKKWVSEQLMKQSLQLDQAIVQEVTRLIEGKNIANNLEVIKSAPIDKAYSPPLPKQPRLPLFLLLGAFLGAFFIALYYIVEAALHGIEATEENLKVSGHRVIGTLTHHCTSVIAEEDLETLRNLKNWVYIQNPVPSILALIEGSGPNYAHGLAKLLHKECKRVIIVPLQFNEGEIPGYERSLLAYLEGKIDYPQIYQKSYYSHIQTGGSCRYGNELIQTQAFQDLLDSLLDTYDWIILTSNANPTSAEAKALTEIASASAITLTTEKLHELSPYKQTSTLCFLIDGSACQSSRF